MAFPEFSIPKYSMLTVESAATPRRVFPATKLDGIALPGAGPVLLPFHVVGLEVPAQKYAHDSDSMGGHFSVFPTSTLSPVARCQGASTIWGWTTLKQNLDSETKNSLPNGCTLYPALPRWRIVLRVQTGFILRSASGISRPEY